MKLLSRINEQSGKRERERERERERKRKRKRERERERERELYGSCVNFERKKERDK